MQHVYTALTFRLAHCVILKHLHKNNAAKLQRRFATYYINIIYSYEYVVRVDILYIIYILILLLACLLDTLLITLLTLFFTIAVSIDITSFEPCCDPVNLPVDYLVNDRVACLLAPKIPIAVTVGAQGFEMCRDLVAMDITKAPKMGAKLMLKLCYLSS